MSAQAQAPLLSAKLHPPRPGHRLSDPGGSQRLVAEFAVNERHIVDYLIKRVLLAQEPEARELELI